jgi:hypothetical protein
MGAGFAMKSIICIKMMQWFKLISVLNNYEMLSSGIKS